MMLLFSQADPDQQQRRHHLGDGVKTTSQTPTRAQRRGGGDRTQPSAITSAMTKPTVAAKAV
jgi:hypothetical protein